jgi:PAS domain-containing protein
MRDAINILLVQDNSNDALLVRKAITESRFNTDELYFAKSVNEASVFMDGKINLLLVDITLPDSDGLEKLGDLTRMYPDVCLIVLTGSIDEDIALEVVRQGAQNYLSKDELDGRTLNRTISLSLERHQILQKLKATERELLQSKRFLEKSEARLLEAQAVAKVGSWETELATMSVFWSAETFHIFDLNPTTYKPTHSSFLDYVHQQDKARVDEAFRQSFSHSEMNMLEHRIVTAQGTEKWVQEYWKVYHDQLGNPLRAAGTCQDITERKTVEAKNQLNEQRLLKAQAIGKLGYWQIDLETDTIWASKEAMRIYGFLRRKEI